MRVHRRLTIWILATLGGMSAIASGSERQLVNHQNTKFWIFRLDPNKEQLDLVWKDAQCKPYRQFEKMRLAMRAQGKKLRFITNAGIYERGPKPLGIHVENSKTLVPLNTRPVKEGDRGWGNFYLHPSGVFYIDEEGAPAVKELHAYQQSM